MANEDRAFQQVFQEVCREIRSNGNETQQTEEFAKLTSNRSRVEYVCNSFGIREKLGNRRRTLKDSDKATQLKIAGNKHYQQKRFMEALCLYNQSILLARRDVSNSTLSICFANRSAVLFQLGFYDQTMRDVQAALNNGYPENMQYKLLIRKAKCLILTNSTEVADSIEEAKGSLNKASLKEHELVSWENELESLVQRQEALTLSEKSQEKLSITNDQVNSSYPALSSLATVASSPEYGRYVEASNDISSGSVCLTEKPYSAVPTEEHSLTHCNHCQTRVHSPYPCRDCADVVYCNMQCENTAWQAYHIVECTNIIDIQNCSVNMGHLALRAAIQAGYQTLKSCMTSTQATNDSSVYASDDYANIFMLQGHEEDRSAKDLFWRAVAAVYLSYYADLEKWSSNSDAMLTLAEAVLHHLQVFPCNAHEIYEVLYYTSSPCESENIEIGAGIYATLSMFNHSCDPSVVRVFTEGNTCVMKSLSPITKGEQIFDNYGALYAVQEQPERQQKLSTQYYFDCSCVPCVHQWQPYVQMSYTDEPMYKCQKCASLIYDNQCDTCNTKIDKQKFNTVLGRAKDSFDKELSELFSGKVPLDSMYEKEKKLSNYSDLVNKLVLRPYKTLNDCQEALKHVYGIQGNITLIAGNREKEVV